MKEKLDTVVEDPNFYSGSNGKKTKGGNKVTYSFDISWSAIFKVLATVFLIFFASKIIQVFVIFFFAFVVMASLMPIKNFFRSKRIPNPIAILITYLLIVTLLVTVGFLISQPIVTESSKLLDELPDIAKNLSAQLESLFGRVPGVIVSQEELNRLLSKEVFTQLLTKGASGIDVTIGTISGFGSILSSFFIGLIISIYFMFDHDHYLDFILGHIQDDRKRVLVKELFADVETKLGTWMFTQGLIMLVIGSLTFILLTILKVNFALPLALASGLFGIIPTFGPIFMGGAIVLFSLASNGLNTAIFVTIGLMAISQVDNIFITPRLMSNVAGLSPVAVLISVMIGFALGGVLGVIFTVPVLILLKLGLDFYRKIPK